MTVQYKVDGVPKTCKVPDTEIANLMQKLQIDKKEAVKLWMCDNGKIQNTEQNELDKKAKNSNVKNRGFAYSPDKQKTQRERTHKENFTKSKIITEVAKLLESFASDVEIVNKEKLINFSLDGKKFKLDLIQSREKKS